MWQYVPRDTESVYLSIKRKFFFLNHSKKMKLTMIGNKNSSGFKSKGTFNAGMLWRDAIGEKMSSECDKDK